MKLVITIITDSGFEKQFVQTCSPDVEREDVEADCEKILRIVSTGFRDNLSFNVNIPDDKIGTTSINGTKLLSLSANIIDD